MPGMTTCLIFDRSIADRPADTRIQGDGRPRNKSRPAVSPASQASELQKPVPSGRRTEEPSIAQTALHKNARTGAQGRGRDQRNADGEPSAFQSGGKGDKKAPAENLCDRVQGATAQMQERRAREERRARRRLSVGDALAVQREVETFFFLGLRRAQTDEGLDHHEDDEGARRRTTRWWRRRRRTASRSSAFSPSALMAGSAKTPVSRAPTMPPMPWTPKASRLSS